jgi:hypothetical protein
MRGGRLDTLIRIKRPGALARDGRSRVAGATTVVVETLAQYIPGVGSERFASAENIASAPSVFVIRRQSDTESIDAGDQVVLVEDGVETRSFDIKSVRPSPQNPRWSIELSGVAEGATL